MGKLYGRFDTILRQKACISNYRAQHLSHYRSRCCLQCNNGLLSWCPNAYCSLPVSAMHTNDVHYNLPCAATGLRCTTTSFRRVMTLTSYPDLILWLRRNAPWASVYSAEWWIIRVPIVDFIVVETSRHHNWFAYCLSYLASCWKYKEHKWSMTVALLDWPSFNGTCSHSDNRKQTQWLQRGLACRATCLWDSTCRFAHHRGLYVFVCSSIC